MSVQVTRIELSVGSLDLFRFDNYDHSFPRHSHDCVTIGVFGKGNGCIRMHGSTAPAADGCLLAIGSDSPHSADPLRGRGWTYRSLYPSQELMNAALESPGVTATFQSPVIHDPTLGSAIGALHVRLERTGASLGEEERLLEILREVVFRHGGGKGVDDVRKPRGAVAIASTYLQENYASAVKLSELSGVCGMSPFHLIRSFRDVTGMTPHSYLTQVRSNRAREMLICGEAISTTAFRCGFSDQSHLTRTFKRIYGVTPGAYMSASSRARRRRA